MKIAQCIVCVLFLIGAAGCHSSKIPDGFPQSLTPFTVKLQNQGQPVEGAAVSLISEDANAGYLATALTGNDGIAKLETSINVFSRPGVPAGKYKGIIAYRPKVPSDLTLEEKGTLSDSEIVKREAMITKELGALPEIVPKNWGNFNTTPVRITVPESGGSITIETTDPKTFVQ
ncbi:MAG: carboxypeptidase-like regulatory domain-containing protein [Planctomycetaceae bacterium]|nr:carboxypeptidase-like regulatory domain-containing protein [Planctomycetaceae bacterium]